MALLCSTIKKVHEFSLHYISLKYDGLCCAATAYRKQSLLSFFFSCSGPMEWSEQHDIALMKNVTVLNPFKAKKKRRPQAWVFVFIFLVLARN